MNTVWILGDQLSPEHAALAATSPRESRVLMVESKARGSALRYHQLKLVLVYSAMRHFARDLRDAGWEVDYQVIENTGTFEDGVRRHLGKHQPASLVLAEPNSFAETDAVLKLGRKLGIPVELVPTKQFLVSRGEFREWAGSQKRLVMKNHYRRMRERFGFLMEKDGQPVGGAWNFDPENRATFHTWKHSGAPRPKTPPHEAPDEITRDVMRMVRAEFPDHPGDVRDFWLPVDRAAALRWLRYFIDERLPNFGAFEDMMAEREPHLFHSVLSSSLNLGLLTPRECVESAIAAYDRGAAPINSVEGYVRQVIGWREFINGVYWLRGPEYKTLNSLGAEHPLPAFFYTAETEMNCLHHVVKQNLSLGWNHHIQRLMVIGNFFLISGINPQEALRWYHEMYVDGYDWVMAPNVLGMALYADGGFMATKPYAATSTYINRMSNYCANCRFDPAQKTGPDACPFNYLYWHFIDQHAERFALNPRMRAIVTGWMKRSDGNKETVRSSARAFLDALS
ncbi:MAG TPA: cryptochrome/photolyase family protein [Chthoniobacteraceae bacterium]